jgi:transposase
VRLVRETGRPVAQVGRDLGINEGTLGNWVNADRRCPGEADGAPSEDERAELAWLRKENAELAMERDVLIAYRERLITTGRSQKHEPAWAQMALALPSRRSTRSANSR